ncbi:hypothetical protein ACS0TY_000015 [Phlomoides rotata]
MPLSLSIFLPTMAVSFAFFNFVTFLLSLMNKKWEKSKAPNNHQRLPPGPLKLPVIGNLHHIIGSLPHHYPFRDLANTYGSLMHLKFDEVSTIIVSSPDIAREVLKTHNHHLLHRVDRITLRCVSCMVIWGPVSGLFGGRWSRVLGGIGH